MENYPSNSHKSKQKKDESQKLQKVITGSAKIKKKSGIRKFMDIFIPDDVESIKDFIISDVIIPAAKKTCSDIVDAILYPNGGGRKSSSNVSYRNYYEKDHNKRDYRRGGIRNGFVFDDVFLNTRGEAEMVLEILDEQITRYNLVSIADLYDAVGISDNNYMNDKYGWTDIRGARIVPTRDGYLIKMPRPVPLD